MNNFKRPEYPDVEIPWLLDLIPPTAEKLLDIGCHRGNFGNTLKQRQSVEVWGVEPDHESASVAQDRLDSVIIDFFNQSNPIPDTYFDIVTFNDSLEHMTDPIDALELAKKKLKIGGRVHCCVPNMRHIDNLEHLLFDKDWRYESSGIRDKTHLRFFTEKSIVRLFEECGYDVIKTVSINENWWDKKKPLRRLFFRIFPNVTKDMKNIQIVVIAEPKNNKINIL